MKTGILKYAKEKKKLYYSRRSKTFDQSVDSQDDGAPTSILDTAAIICKDT